MLVEVLDNGKKRLKIADFDTSRALERDKNAVYTDALGEINKSKLQSWYTHIVITGDYNLPDINWDFWTTKLENPNNICFKFIECLRDNFVFQHINKPTRGRGTNKTNNNNSVA